MKSIETKVAERRVDASVAQFESAVNHLIDKVEDTQAAVQERIDHAVETVNKPIEFVRDVKDRGLEFVDMGRERARDLALRVRANPEPFVSWAALAFGLYLCYRAVRRDRQFRNTHSWSQLEP